MLYSQEQRRSATVKNSLVVCNYVGVAGVFDGCVAHKFVEVTPLWR